VLRLQLNKQERAILAIIVGASMLVWSVLALSWVRVHAVPPGAHDIASPLALRSAPASEPPAPTLALPAQATPIPSPSPTPTPTTPPTLTPTPTPTPDPSVLVDHDTTVIALLGIDNERSDSIWRTDSIILVFIQPKREQISMLSIPRDLWVSIPGHGQNRINTVDALGERTQYPGGGPALLDQTLRDNLKLRIDHYVRIDFGGFVRLIDAFGGVTVYVEQPITDSFPDPTSLTGNARITLPVGPRDMDGRMALSYCRSRMTTSDFDRSRRQQQVLLALAKKASSPETLIKAPKLWAEFQNTFATDLTMVQAIQIAYIAYGIGLENLHSTQLGLEAARPWTTPSGAQVLLPKSEAIDGLLHDLLYEPEPG
jgi:LCP family protein required for cell wall assembly